MVEDVTLFGFAKVETRYDEQQGALLNSMTGRSTTLHYKSEFLKCSWNSRSYIFVLSSRFTFFCKKQQQQQQMVKKKRMLKLPVVNDLLSTCWLSTA